MLTGRSAAIVSVIVVILFGLALTLMLVHPVAIQSDALNLLNIMYGSLVANFGTVVQYWLGSSAGSKIKDDVISNMAQNNQAKT